MSTPEKPRTIVEALAAVMGEVQAVRKGDRNQQQGYSFRGVDAVVNAVGPALRKHGVVVVPLVEQVDYATVEVGQKRTPMRECTVRVRYVFHGPAGDTIECVSAGEAMDSGDKSTPKAMSVSYRVALLQALCIPTDEPEVDADAYQRAPATRRGGSRSGPKDSDSAEDAGPRMISEPMSRRLHQLFNQSGITERAARLTYTSEICGREVPSSKELTFSEARLLIKTLEEALAEPYDENPSGGPA